MQLRVRLEARQHTAGVVVIEEFATEFEIKFALKLSYTLLDMFALYANLFVVVETVLHAILPLP